MKQTFIINHWYGAPTYIEAARKEINEGHHPDQYGHDFDRVGCKSLKTALKYLKGWRDQAKEKGYTTLYRTLTDERAQYEIIETPDGINPAGVVAKGFIKDL